MHRNLPANPLFLRDEAVDLQFESWLLAVAGIQHVCAEPFAKSEIDQTDYFMLAMIKRYDRMTMALLVDLCGRPKQVVSRRLLLLEKRGLIERQSDPLDRRQRLLHLSEKGQEIEGHVHDRVRHYLRRAFAATGSEAVQGFASVLEKLVEPDHLRMLRVNGRLDRR